jgi:F0F1-type ATP synthase assembly protein I
MDNTGVDYEDQSDDFTILTVTIPTLSEWGMIILALLLLAAGTIGIIRRRKTAIEKAV